MSREYAEQLEAHMDEGGTYTAANVRDLIQMVICPVCKGNGYVRKVDGIEQCSVCDSKGELDVAV